MQFLDWFAGWLAGWLAVRLAGWLAPFGTLQGAEDPPLSSVRSWPWLALCETGAGVTIAPEARKQIAKCHHLGWFPVSKAAPACPNAFAPNKLARTIAASTMKRCGDVALGVNDIALRSCNGSNVVALQAITKGRAW